MIDIRIQHSVSDGTRRFALDVEFASNAGVVALYGASGAGKSLSLQAIAGLIRPERGFVRIGARTLFDSQQRIDVPPRDRSLGYLFQHYALFPHLTVRENIAFGLRSWWRRRLDAASQRRVDELLDLFELRSMADSRPSALSGGQQQRTALARALACKPEALLLDEPFAALNPMLRSGLRRELGELRARLGIPMVMITHDIDDLAALAEHVFVIDGGRVVSDIDLRSMSASGTRSQALDTLRGEPLDAPQLRRREQLADALGHA